MIELCRDLVALVAAADPENGGHRQVPYEQLKALAVRAAELIQPRELMEIEIDAIEQNLASREHGAGPSCGHPA